MTDPTVCLAGPASLGKSMLDGDELCKALARVDRVLLLHQWSLEGVGSCLRVDDTETVQV